MTATTTKPLMYRLGRAAARPIRIVAPSAPIGAFFDATGRIINAIVALFCLVFSLITLVASAVAEVFAPVLAVAFGFVVFLLLIFSGEPVLVVPTVLFGVFFLSLVAALSGAR
jgi:hypothetical protein